MKKFALLFVIAVLLLMTACDTVTYTYELTPVTVTDPYAPMYNSVDEYDRLTILSDGNIVFSDFAMSVGGNKWYRNYIVHPDGYEVHGGYHTVPGRKAGGSHEIKKKTLDVYRKITAKHVPCTPSGDFSYVVYDLV